MEQPTTKEIVFGYGAKYVYPENPFESIGFALSGGGFRAASYGLGTLSVFDALKVKDQHNQETSLLHKVKFISSASGGSITLLVYAAAIRKGLSFNEFFKHLNTKLTGEKLLQDALNLLADNTYWEDKSKSRNPINAFSKVYHHSLLDFLEPEQKNLGFIMGFDAASQPTHLDEFCFNASEFYSGLSFRFQGANKDWADKKGGQFGSSNIIMNWDDKLESMKTLKQLRLADIIASSSCFPLGFEPIMYPRDFSYKQGPTIEELKKAMQFKLIKGEEDVVENSSQAKKVTTKQNLEDISEFGLMDGGICDNQGLLSLLHANDRNRPKGYKGLHNRFDLMMVSDVTSFFMDAFKEPVAEENKWNQKTPKVYWSQIKSFAAKVTKGVTIAVVVGAVLTAVSLYLLFIEELTFSSVLLAIVSLLLFGLALLINKKYKDIVEPELGQVLKMESLDDIYKKYFKEDTIYDRIADKLIPYLEIIKLQDLMQMVYTRVKSTEKMVSDVFLKQVRRLIYDRLFSNTDYKYRRLDNTIYRLSKINDKNRRMPQFDNQEGEDKTLYDLRKKEFQKEVKEYCKHSATMSNLADIAFKADTTLWFTAKEETECDKNVRKAIIVCGQFSTCYSLLQYTLSLRHSRNFSGLSQASQDRIESLLEQLKSMMSAFNSNPFFLYNKLTEENSKA